MGDGYRPKLGDGSHGARRLQSRRTEEAYLGWIRRFILVHGKKHPEILSAEEGKFLPGISARIARDAPQSLLEHCSDQSSRGPKDPFQDLEE